MPLGFRLFRRWKETPATVWSAHKASRNPFITYYSVVINYQIERKYYSSELTTLKPYIPGDVFPLRVDPKKPRRNELILRSRMLRAIPMMAFVLMVFAGLYFIFTVGGAAPPPRQ